MAERTVEVASDAAGTPAPGEPRLWSHRWLLAVAIGGPVLEVGLLWALGVTSALGMAPGVTAPAPFATFHDLRWLMVYHRSWPGFAAEALALLAFRGALTALLVGLSWPSSLPRPRSLPCCARAPPSRWSARCCWRRGRGCCSGWR